MIGTLVHVAKELARYEGKMRGLKQEEVVLHRLCQTAEKGKEAVKVVVIDIQNKEVRLEDYTENQRFKYLYGLPTSNHAIAPSWVLQLKKDRIETIRAGLEQVKNGLKNVGAPGAIFEQFAAWEGSGLVSEIFEATKSEKTVLLTVSWDGKMPGEHRDVVENFMDKRIFGESRAKMQGEGRCALCGEEGRVSSAIPFDFFTVKDKPAFYPFGRVDDAWKYAPVCGECSKWLYVAQSYLEENLQTKVAGHNAYLLPDLEPGASEIEGSFIQFLWEWHDVTENKIVPPDQSFVFEADNLFEALIEESDKRFRDRPPFRSASLVFYEPGQKFLFLHTISEILPKNLKLTNLALKRVSECLRDDALGEVGGWIAGSLTGKFDFVGEAWKWPSKGQTSTHGTLRFTALHIVEAIVTQRSLPEKEFWHDADNLLRAVFLETVSSGKQNKSVRQAIEKRVGLLWAIWALIYRFDLLTGGDDMVNTTTKHVKSNELNPEFWEKFFGPRLVLDTPPKRAAFLIGVLFGWVEYKQRSEREAKAGEMPILSRLRGLTVSRQEIFQRLLPELMVKLRQLDANTVDVRAVEEGAAHFAAVGGDLSDEETRFCFCLGWALSYFTISTIGKRLGSPEAEQREKVFEEG